MMRHVDLPEDRIPGPGQRSILNLEGKSIALFNVDDTLYAIDDSCPHAGGSLLVGKLEGRMVKCPAHGLTFDLSTGCMRNGTLAVATYAIEWVNNQRTIALPESTQEDAPL